MHARVPESACMAGMQRRKEETKERSHKELACRTKRTSLVDAIRAYGFLSLV